MAASPETNHQKTIPTLWRERILKRDFEIVLGKMLQSDQGREDETEEFYLRTANVQWEGVNLSDVKTMWFSPTEKLGLLLREGDLVVNEGGDAGRCAIWRSIPESFYFQNAINRVRARTSASTRFLYYWLYNLKYAGFIDAMVSRITIAHLTAEKLARVPWPDVPSAEQQRIAAYLDASCAAIDAAVAAKRRQLSTLEALRKETVTRAITRGLKPSTRAKPSGEDWLGEIPAHWSAPCLKRLLREPLTYGLNEAAELEEREFPRYLRITDFDDDGNLREDTFRSLPHEIAEKALLEPNDVLFARSGATVGKTFIFRNYDGEACFAGYLIRARTLLWKLDPLFLYLFTKSTAYESWKNFIFTQATIQNISAAKYNYLAIPLPPLEEQRAIVDYVEAKSGEFRSLAACIEAQIATLTAYRKSLIHECVTGQRRITEADLSQVKAHG
jgi:type I restriction enzyme S subunit